MFTGIVQGTAEVIAIIEREGLRTHRVRFPQVLAADLAPGASVAHNGCCLTVVAVDGQEAAFDVMAETLRLTNLGALRVGDRVNVERAARLGDEIGGHSMSGHIMGTAEVVRVLKWPNNRQVWLRPPQSLMKYVLTKGYIGVDGISLTIGEAQGGQFAVNLIPETLARTNIAGRRPGERVNIEIDPQTQAVVDTVERVLSGSGAGGRVRVRGGRPQGPRRR
jgi:riboflavin synthase